MHLQSSLMMMIGCCHSLQQANPLLISKYFGRCESAGSLLTTADADDGTNPLVAVYEKVDPDMIFKRVVDSIIIPFT